MGRWQARHPDEAEETSPLHNGQAKALITDRFPEGTDGTLRAIVAGRRRIGNIRTIGRSALSVDLEVFGFGPDDVWPVRYSGLPAASSCQIATLDAVQVVLKSGC